jgi:subtilase family serine protease
MSEVSTVVTPPAMPDLVGSFSISPAKTTFSTTEQVIVTAQVTNQGDAPAGPFWVDLYINPTTAPGSTNIAWNTTCSLQPCQGIAWYVKDGLAPGQSITLTSTSDSYMSGYTIWSGQFSAGTSDLYLYVDSWNPGVATGGVAESNETNNRAEQHGIVVSGTSAQSVDESAEALPERPAHPSN